MKGKVLRDPIHGDVYLNDFETKIMSTKEFQRLSGIKQLGFANLVYRSANHTRFEHSIGTCWICKRILNQLKLNHERFGLKDYLYEIDRHFESKYDSTKWRHIVTAAALLHDITHIPFGHTLEDELEGVLFFGKHDAIESKRLHYFLYDEHSEIAQLFNNSEELVEGFDNNFVRDLIYVILRFEEKFTVGDPKELWEIRSFKGCISEAIKEMEKAFDLNGNKNTRQMKERLQMLKELNNIYESIKSDFFPFMSDMIHNTISADILDYLDRDIYFTGLDAKYDKKIYQYLTLGKENDNPNSLRLVIFLSGEKGPFRTDIVSEILNILNIRYSLVEKVYYHHAKVAASTMLSKLLQITGINEEVIYKEGFTDSELLCDIRNRLRELEGRAEYKEMIDLLLKRRLFKPFFIVEKDKFNISQEFREILTRFREDKENIGKEERELSNSVPRDGDYDSRVLVYCPYPKMQAKYVEVKISYQEDGKNVGPIPLKTIDNPSIKKEVDILEKKYQKLWKLYFCVHPEDIADPERKKIIYKACKDKVFGKESSRKYPDIEGVPSPMEFVSRFNEWKDKQILQQHGRLRTSNKLTPKRIDRIENWILTNDGELKERYQKMQLQLRGKVGKHQVIIDAIFDEKFRQILAEEKVPGKQGELL